MLGTFPKAFSLGRLSNDNFPNVLFPNRQLPKGEVRPSEAPQAAVGGGSSAAARMGYEPSAAARTDWA